MKNLFLSVALLTSAAYLNANDHFESGPTAAEVDWALKQPGSSQKTQEELERIVFLPSAADIDAKLKTALGEKYSAYIAHNQELCDRLANKSMPAHSIGSIIAITIFHYSQENERQEIKSKVCTALVQDNPHALARLKETNYITTNTTPDTN